MAFPTSLDYQRALQNPAFAFPDVAVLAQAQAEINGLGIPRPYPGSFTTTFRLRGERDWAIRCYTREVRDVSERYSAITRFLETHSDPALTMARLIPRGILVGPQRYDIIQMDWVLGDRLDDYVARIVSSESASLADLATSFLDLGTRLDSLGIAHGDIQHGNVIVDQTGNLRLVDYDDMFLPDLRHLRFSSGLGQENYQHPRRASTNFDEALDRFSLISIYITLQALSVKPDLWQKHDGGDDNLLFRKADFLDPYASKLFQDLDRLGRVKELVDRFASVCVGKYEDIPSISDFLDGRFSYSRFVSKVVETRPSTQGIEPGVISALRFSSISTPPTIGTGSESAKPGGTRTEKMAPNPLRADVAASTGTRPDSAQHADLSTGPSSLGMSTATNLPPSNAGIPPSSYGIPPVSGASASSFPSFGFESSKGAALLRVLAGLGIVAVLIGFAGLLASRNVHSPEAAALSSAPATFPSAKSLSSPHPLARTTHSFAESSRVDIAASSEAALRPLVVKATPQGLPQTPPASIERTPDHRPRAVATKTGAAPVIALHGGVRHPITQALADKNKVVLVDAAVTSVPRADAQQPSAFSSPACDIPDRTAHLVVKATPDLSARTIAAAAGKSVVVEVDLAADGSVRNASIVTGSGDTRLDLAALSVATRSTYASTEANCVASPGSVTMTIGY